MCFFLFSVCPVNNKIISLSNYYSQFIFKKISVVLSTFYQFLFFSFHVRKYICCLWFSKACGCFIFEFISHINSLHGVNMNSVNYSTCGYIIYFVAALLSLSEVHISVAFNFRMITTYQFQVFMT